MTPPDPHDRRPEEQHPCPQLENHVDKLERRRRELEAEVERLQVSLEGIRRLLYGSRSAYEASGDRERPHHYDSAVCPYIVRREDGEHPSACSYRVEQIEAVAEIVETALSDKYAAATVEGSTDD